MAGQITPPILLTGTLSANGEDYLAGTFPLDSFHNRAAFVTAEVVGFLPDAETGIPQYGCYKAWALVRTRPGQPSEVVKQGQFSGNAQNSFLPLYWDNLGYTITFEGVSGGVRVKVSNVNNDYPTECSAAVSAVDVIGD